MDAAHRALRAGLLPLSAGLIASLATGQFVLGTDYTVLGNDDGEITPDGRYAFVRDNLSFNSTRVFDTATGQLVAYYPCPAPNPAIVLNNGAQDAVVATDDRAVVLGQCTPIFDLSNLAAPMVVLDTGESSKDLAATPDGRLLAIRGGRPGFYNTGGGLYVVDLATGAVLASAPGEPADNTGVPYSFDVDSVVTSNDHAAFLSVVQTAQGPRTRVAIFDLYTPPNALPTLVYETALGGGDKDQFGPPHDIAITPDGQYVAVRSELSVGLYRLDGAQTRRMWHKRLYGEPGPFGYSAMDSIEVTNEWIATISRDSNGGFAAQVDLFDIAGNQRFDDIPGDPHDLTFTPDAERLLVRTSAGLFLYDVTQVPPGVAVPFDASVPLASSHTSFGAGMDSLVALDDVAVTLSREGNDGRIDIWEIGQASIARRAGGYLGNRPLDLDISPNQRLLGVAGTRKAQVWDLVTFELLLDTPTVNGTDYYPWCDGIAMNDDSLVAFGHSQSQGGWIMLVDLFSAQVAYCGTSPNSVGAGATIYATGSPSAASNDLELIARDLPSQQVVQFVYGTAQASTPFGDGTLCVGGQAFRFPFGRSEPGGVARRTVDNTAAPQLGGAIMAGTTWNFQVLYRDPAGPGGTGGAGFNASDGVEIPFGS